MALLRVLVATTFLCAAASNVVANEPIRVLIVDGRNNHAWGSTTNALRQMLLQTGRFSSGTASAARAINGKSDSCDNPNKPARCPAASTAR